MPSKCLRRTCPAAICHDLPYPQHPEIRDPTYISIPTALRPARPKSRAHRQLALPRNPPLAQSTSTPPHRPKTPKMSSARRNTAVAPLSKSDRTDRQTLLVSTSYLTYPTSTISWVPRLMCIRTYPHSSHVLLFHPPNYVRICSFSVSV